MTRQEGNNRRFEDKDELLKKGKRGALHMIFGRTILVVVLMALQVLLVVAVFEPLSRYGPLLYGGITLLSALIVLHLVNQNSDQTVRLTWAVLVLAVPTLGVILYGFVKLDLGHRMIHHRLEELTLETIRFVPRQKQLMDYLWT